MIDYYCEMHGCKFIPLVSSIFVRARRRSYKRAPVYYATVPFRKKALRAAGSQCMLKCNYAEMLLHSRDAAKLTRKCRKYYRSNNITAGQIPSVHGAPS